VLDRVSQGEITSGDEAWDEALILLEQYAD